MGEKYEFVCPECSQDIIVDRSVRKSLLEEGCIICEADVTTGDFTKVNGLVQ
ncbi:MAG: zinc ribbon domain-containing protein [Halobacteria archaeon]|nr:zinc ribbon domain-containing protein [Halobacteria archaeon]